ncbi:hypothetical protein JCM15457_937 [Liquorilactobacillus sucicola DSM 21376 = JCM 15457]|uniref:DNA-entry nuclease n=1 Tax=Liquorilactobacillus sucicola DSM 21376 = JCM 15457 TaxID=1423806 RepID=A0A023CWR2_9LACO|nr:hypothetical protein [Liquorilactobacillus sucicola]KRN06100.1 hypothetical protein FD15_GL001293 [Liquorilactobacillus sucicola DSM 21376 = JCM 15457]GAJ26026.1 hypothetical protein JCM15457_937 [Liquorilactobacillus sucicola DSM 21376 = JCM 15457]
MFHSKRFNGYLAKASVLILSIFSFSSAVTFTHSITTQEVKAAQVKQSKLIEVTSKKDDLSSKYQTNENGIFYIKGKSIKNAQLWIKGKDFKTIKRNVSKNEHFKVKVKLADSKKKMKLKVLATAGKKHSQEQMSIYNRSDTYLTAVASSKAAKSSSIAAMQSASSSAAESSKSAAAESSKTAESSSIAKAQSEAAAVQASRNAESSSTAAASSRAAASSAAVQTQSDNNTTGSDLYTGTQGQIIGNSRSHIYHVPGQAGYHMNSANAVYFNNEQEAQAQGYRKALR